MDMFFIIPRILLMLIVCDWKVDTQLYEYPYEEGEYDAEISGDPEIADVKSFDIKTKEEYNDQSSANNEGLKEHDVYLTGNKEYMKAIEGKGQEDLSANNNGLKERGVYLSGNNAQSKNIGHAFAFSGNIGEEKGSYYSIVLAESKKNSEKKENTDILSGSYKDIISDHYIAYQRGSISDEHRQLGNSKHKNENEGNKPISDSYIRNEQYDKTLYTGDEIYQPIHTSKKDSDHEPYPYISNSHIEPIKKIEPPSDVDQNRYHEAKIKCPTTSPTQLQINVPSTQLNSQTQLNFDRKIYMESKNDQDIYNNARLNPSKISSMQILSIPFPYIDRKDVNFKIYVDQTVFHQLKTTEQAAEYFNAELYPVNYVKHHSQKSTQNPMGNYVLLCKTYNATKFNSQQFMNRGPSIYIHQNSYSPRKTTEIPFFSTSSSLNIPIEEVEIGPNDYIICSYHPQTTPTPNSYSVNPYESMLSTKLPSYSKFNPGNNRYSTEETKYYATNRLGKFSIANTMKPNIIFSKTPTLEREKTTPIALNNQLVTGVNNYPLRSSVAHVSFTTPMTPKQASKQYANQRLGLSTTTVYNEAIKNLDQSLVKYYSNVPFPSVLNYTPFENHYQPSSQTYYPYRKYTTTKRHNYFKITQPTQVRIYTPTVPIFDKHRTMPPISHPRYFTNHPNFPKLTISNLGKPKEKSISSPVYNLSTNKLHAETTPSIYTSPQIFTPYMKRNHSRPRNDKPLYIHTTRPLDIHGKFIRKKPPYKNEHSTSSPSSILNYSSYQNYNYQATNQTQPTKYRISTTSISPILNSTPYKNYNYQITDNNPGMKHMSSTTSLSPTLISASYTNYNYPTSIYKPTVTFPNSLLKPTPYKNYDYETLTRKPLVKYMTTATSTPSLLNSTPYYNYQTTTHKSTLKRMTTSTSASPILNFTPYKNYNFKTTIHKPIAKHLITTTTVSPLLNFSPYKNYNFQTTTHKPTTKYRTTKSSFSPLLNSTPYKNYNYEKFAHKPTVKHMTTSTSVSPILNFTPYKNYNYQTTTHKPITKYTTTKTSSSSVLNSAPYKNYNYQTTHHKSYMKYMTTKTSFSHIFNTSPFRNYNYQATTLKPIRKYETTKRHDHFKVTRSFHHKTVEPTVSTIVNPQTNHTTLYPHHFNKSLKFPDLPIFKWIKQRFLPTLDYNSSSKMDPSTTVATYHQRNNYSLKNDSSDRPSLVNTALPFITKLNIPVSNIPKLSFNRKDYLTNNTSKFLTQVIQLCRKFGTKKCFSTTHKSANKFTKAIYPSVTKSAESSATSFHKPTYYQSTQKDVQATKKGQLHYSTRITKAPEHVTKASNVPLLSMVYEKVPNISENYLSTTTATVETRQTKQFNDAQMSTHATREQYKPLSTVKSSNHPLYNNFEYPIFYRAKNIHHAPVQQNIHTTSQEILKNTDNYPSTFASSFYYPTIILKDTDKKEKFPSNSNSDEKLTTSLNQKLAYPLKNYESTTVSSLSAFTKDKRTDETTVYLPFSKRHNSTLSNQENNEMTTSLPITTPSSTVYDKKVTKSKDMSSTIIQQYTPLIKTSIKMYDDYLPVIFSRSLNTFKIKKADKSSIDSFNYDKKNVSPSIPSPEKSSTNYLPPNTTPHPISYEIKKSFDKTVHNHTSYMPKVSQEVTKPSIYFQKVTQILNNETYTKKNERTEQFRISTFDDDYSLLASKKLVKLPIYFHSTTALPYLSTPKIKKDNKGANLLPATTLLDTETYEKANTDTDLLHSTFKNKNVTFPTQKPVKLPIYLASTTVAPYLYTDNLKEVDKKVTYFEPSTTLLNTIIYTKENARIDRLYTKAVEGKYAAFLTQESLKLPTDFSSTTNLPYLSTHKIKEVDKIRTYVQPATNSLDTVTNVHTDQLFTNIFENKYASFSTQKPVKLPTDFSSTTDLPYLHQLYSQKLKIVDKIV
ncbi:hypothetical protein CDAR_4991 [Caerostris darwini]|uniref:Uncharacterized protein n=1 Tax=Caerostris darwini TaxID=1538125 RepID=A0AAV4P7S4_9ARAC|nr:hypothetical protein CDAR_4991 [Caerostris darwini]